NTISENSPSTNSSAGVNSFKVTRDNVKVFGRAINDANNSYLWFGLTDAGIEYAFTGTTTTITVAADNGAYSSENPARIAIYADGKLDSDVLIKDKTSKFTVTFNSNGRHIVRLIKLSECANGSIRLTEIEADSNKIEPTAAGNKKIEFVGDSITCGYGVDGTEGTFSTKTEDGSKTYAYIAAQSLNADYSMFSFSGFGIISGYSTNGERSKDSTIPPIYDKLGFSYWSQFENDSSITQLKDVKWDPKAFEPDLVVINLGTNDNSYMNSINSADKKASEAEAFTEEYENFISTIRSTHPKAEILCTLGIMGQDLYPQIEKAVSNYKTKTGDTKVNAFKFNVQNTEKNGKGIDWHPAPKSHSEAANELVNEINKLYGW
ncbi:hypothetical protein BCR32DRAFT_189848, partial [Anaeromyces robustus]